MSTARLQKREDAEQLREELADVPHAILVDFQGLNVEGATNLRRQLREGEASLKVVKNSTALRAIEDLPLDKLADVFVGQTAIAYTDGDVVSLAKTLRDFAKEFETPNFKAGIVDGSPISAEDFDALAELPPREQLIAKALYLMNYPLTGLVTALNGILQGFVVALDQIREKKEAAGETAEPEAAEAAAAEAPAEEASAEEAPEAAEAAESVEAEEAAAEPAAEEPAEEAVAEDDAPEAEAADVAAEEAEAEEPEAAEEAADESADEAESDEAPADEDAAEKEQT